MNDLHFYSRASQLPWPRSYAGKILVLSHVAMLLPFAAVLVVVAAGASTGATVVAAGAATLTASLITWMTLPPMLRPIEVTAAAIRDYLEQRRLPNLPQRFPDTAGRLMRDTGYALARLDERLRELDGVATTDPVTGVYNRRAGDLALMESLARCQRGSTPLQLLLLDVDGLRECNELHGHSVGDRYLIVLAEALRSTLRGTDWIARWASHEFMVGIVAPAEEADSIAERLGQALQPLEIELDDGRKLPISVSAGLVTAGAADTVLGLHKRAGEALYRAKAAGGGRIAVWSSTSRAAGIRLIAGCVAALLVLSSYAAEAAERSVAVFPFALVNTSLQADQPAELARMERMTAEAGEQLRGRGFTIVDIAPQAAAIEAVGSVHDCNGCELDIARKLGAEIAVVGWVQKVSNLILNLSMQLREVESGRLINAGSVDLRGNTDESWQRSVTYLIENRLFKERG